MAPRRKFILTPMGSTGDVAPFAWLAELLQAAGQDTVAVVQAPFLEPFRAARVRALAYGSAEEYDDILQHPDLWHPRRGFALVARAAERWNRQASPWIRQEIEPGRTTLVAPAIGFCARVAAEALDLPLVTVHLQPFAFLSVVDPPVLQAGLEWLTRSPAWMRHALYPLARWKTNWLLNEPVNELRAEWGLQQPVRRVYPDYWVSRQRILALFPEWFAPRALDWPPQAVTTRFPLRDGPDTEPLHPEVEEFLREGPPPVVFTPGSANRQAARFFQVAQQTCRELGTRGLFVTPFDTQVPRDLPKAIRHFKRVPFSRLLPSCRALVHHGGIGTAAQALAGGIPQLVVPLSHDQPDNAARLRRLGVGDYLYPDQLDAATATATLRRLTTSGDVARACHTCRERLQRQMPPGALVQLLTELA